MATRSIGDAGGRASVGVISGRGPTIGVQSGGSTDGRRLAKMLAFHGNAATAIADVLHGGQLALAHVSMVDFRCSTEGAILVIAAGIAEVSGVFGHRTTLFTGIGHRAPPCQARGLGLDRNQRPADCGAYPI